MRDSKSAIVVYFGLFVGLASACNLPMPSQPADLIITGTITACSIDGEAVFDSALFAQLPRHTIRTTNPWETGEVEYEGVLFSDIIKLVGASGSTVTVSALNDYHADIPVADLIKYGAILADKKNGAPMPVNDKGPYFVIFPFEQHPELKTEERYSQSVWQVNHMEFHS